VLPPHYEKSLLLLHRRLSHIYNKMCYRIASYMRTLVIPVHCDGYSGVSEFGAGLTCELGLFFSRLDTARAAPSKSRTSQSTNFLIRCVIDSLWLGLHAISLQLQQRCYSVFVHFQTSMLTILSSTEQVFLISCLRLLTSLRFVV
jgi:hypothetical protein